MDVFAELDERNRTTVRDVDREALASTIINFMDLLKYNFKQTDLCVPRRAADAPCGVARSHQAWRQISETVRPLTTPLRRDTMRNNLAMGDKRTVRDVLHWTLAKFEKHKKRAYVARFLAPLNIPPEFMHDPSARLRCAHRAARALTPLPPQACKRSCRSTTPCEPSSRRSTASWRPRSVQAAAPSARRWPQGRRPRPVDSWPPLRRGSRTPHRRS